jgi:hypothetical protein
MTAERLAGHATKLARSLPTVDASLSRRAFPGMAGEGYVRILVEIPEKKTFGYCKEGR